MKASIFLAIKREQRNRRSDGFRGRLYENREAKALQDAVITHVTQVTVEDATEKADEIEEPTEDVRSLREIDVRSLREIWEQECDVGISYKTFLQRVKTQKWDLQKALHTPKAR